MSGKKLENEVLSVFCSTKNYDRNKVSIKELKVGFTGASKFILSIDDKEKFFLKVADRKTQKTDVFLIESEAKIYSLFKQWKLVRGLFPQYKGLINKRGLEALVLDYLDLDWGGPWSMKNIKLLDKGLIKLHKTPLTEKDKRKVMEIAISVRELLCELPKKDISDEEKNKPFLDAWNQKESGFESSDGNIYYKGNAGLPQQVLEESENKTKSPPQKLIMHDMNFTNIGFSKSQVYFVDPVYARIGNPLHDRSVIGINILQRIGDDITSETNKFVVNKFLKSKPILAGLIKYHTITAKQSKETSDTAWQKYHQSCAKAALDVFSTNHHK